MTARPGSSTADECAKTPSSRARTAWSTRRRPSSASRSVEAERGSELDEMLVGLERDMYVLMAELATAPENRDKLTPGQSSVSQVMVDRLEPLIDDLTTRFEQPKEFVLPGQNRVAAYLDLGRTVVRRAERAALSAAPPPSLVVPYLNRLSDLLWTMARWQEGEALPAKST